MLVCWCELVSVEGGRRGGRGEEGRGGVGVGVGAGVVVVVCGVWCVVCGVWWWWCRRGVVRTSVCPFERTHATVNSNGLVPAHQPLRLD